LPGYDTTGPFEQAGQTLPEEDVVVGQCDPDAGFGHPYYYRSVRALTDLRAVHAAAL
jgi:hypothetical protein